MRALRLPELWRGVESIYCLEDNKTVVVLCQDGGVRCIDTHSCVMRLAINSAGKVLHEAFSVGLFSGCFAVST